MIYVAADIHGDFVKYQKLLEKIKLGAKDALVILGDVLDRGSSGMKILLDIMDKENIFMILGNHEQIALACLKTLSQVITKESIEKFDEATTEMLVEWVYNLGGQATIEDFSKLSKLEKKIVLDYIEELPLYEEFVINNQKYLLVHGGLENFSPDKDIDDYTIDEIVWNRIDYKKKYFEDTIIITGHTPTRTIEDNPNPDFIYKANNHIAIDCGCVFAGGRLGCLCLNTMEEIYVD
ncbi:MAG: metallophosphoesterase [Clostridia bacterium]